MEHRIYFMPPCIYAGAKINRIVPPSVFKFTYIKIKSARTSGNVKKKNKHFPVVTQSRVEQIISRVIMNKLFNICPLSPDQIRRKNTYFVGSCFPVAWNIVSVKKDLISGCINSNRTIICDAPQVFRQ